MIVGGVIIVAIVVGYLIRRRKKTGQYMDLG